MENRKAINDQIVQWIRHKVEAEYPDDISLVLVYGSYVNGTANRLSDVDCYFIPKTERGCDLGIDFIVSGVGYDLFPISWERAGRIADLQETLLPLIGDAQVLCCGSPEDMQRFLALQQRQKRNLLDDSYARQIALSRFGKARQYSAQMQICQRSSGIRKLAGGIMMSLADAVAIANHDYFHHGLKKQYDDLLNRFPSVPREIVTSYRQIAEAETAQEAMDHALTMLDSVGRYLNIEPTAPDEPIPEAPLTPRLDAAFLAGLYEEIISTFNKIYICCESGNHVLAFLSAVCLQREFDDARTAGCPEHDLLDGFHWQKLDAFAALTRTIENDFVRFITENGGCIKRYETFEQFANARL